MFHSDLMQFKDEMLKNLREMEKKIMTKVNKNQTELSSDLISINASINSIQANNNSIVDSLTQQKLNIDKILIIESDLKKFNSILTGQEKKLNESMIEISYIRDRYEKSLSDTLLVPGIIGNNCKYSNFNEYIINTTKDISRLKTEKDNSKKESKELKQKLEQGLKSLSSMVDTLNNRSKLYTDGAKKSILNLMETKISELDNKNLDLLSKLYKIDNELEIKIKNFDKSLDNYNKENNDKIEKIENKLNIVNKNIEEINKDIIRFKNNEKRYEEEFNELYDMNNNFVNKNIDNNSNNNNNIIIKSDNKINLLFDSNDNKEINNDIIKIINNNISNNSPIKKENIINNSDISSPQKIKTKTKLKEMPLVQKESNLIKKLSKNIENRFSENLPLQNPNNKNNINNNEPLLTFDNLNKNIKFSNSEIANNVSLKNKKGNNEKIIKNLLKSNIKTTPKIENRRISFNKNINLNKNIIFNKEKKSFIINKNNKEIEIKDNFPIIKQKLFNNMLLTDENIFNNNNKHNNINILNSMKNISHFNTKPTSKNKNNNKSSLNKKYNIDKETGVGCNIVKLSIDDESITPYNTNGLLTMASKNFMKKKIIKREDSASFDNIFANNYQYKKIKNHSFNTKQKCNKTVQDFYYDNKMNLDKIINSIDDNIRKEISKTINKSDAFSCRNVKFHIIKK